MPITSTDLAIFTSRAPVDERLSALAAAAILDTLAVLAAGSGEDAVGRIASTFWPQQGSRSQPSFDPGIRLRPEDAALLYGTAAHALDLDDVSMLAILHPSAPVVAALLAARPWSELTGPDLCDAHVIGTEVMIRTGQAIGFDHYRLGYHATATMGIFGATSAVARLLKLDAETTAAALAIAASLASGLRLNFGSMMKPVHVGIAAANALRAIAWACAGVDATGRDLFGPDGVFEALSGGSQVVWPDGVELGAPFAIESPGFESKRYPCCYLLHKIIALGAETWRAGVRLDEIATMRVELPQGGTKPLAHPFPASGAQARFSAPYALIAAIHDGELGFDSFADAAVARPELQARLGDVTVVEVVGAPLTAEQIGAATVRIELVMTDGSIRRLERTAAPGSPADPMSPEDLGDKFVDCVLRGSPGLTQDRARALHVDGANALKSGPLESWLQSLWSGLRPANMADVSRARVGRELA